MHMDMCYKLGSCPALTKYTHLRFEVTEDEWTPRSLPRQAPSLWGSTVVGLSGVNNWNMSHMRFGLAELSCCWRSDCI